MPRVIPMWVVVIWFACVPTFVLGQQLEREPRPKGEPRPQGYLSARGVDFRLILAPPPAMGSAPDREDQSALDEEQSASEERWRSANLDSEYVYPRFEEAFGSPIDREAAPDLVAMLNRALIDVSSATFAAKGYFKRPRPFERVQLRRVCTEAKPPKPKKPPAPVGSSYPSGHSAYGWAAAMILARVAPERAEVVMARATEYAESRVVCGVHFPSDVNAGQVIAAAVVAHLDDSPDFQADLARAHAEYLLHAARSQSPDRQ